MKVFRSPAAPGGGFNRRQVIQAFLAAAVTAVAGPAGRAAAGPMDSRPNLVLIVGEDHRSDFLHSAGHPFLRTPHLDQMAEQGVLFENAFVTTSLNIPSRAAFLTGQYAHTTGIKNHVSPWPNDQRTFFDHLDAAGYDTAYIGQWHAPGRWPKPIGVSHFVTFTLKNGQGRYWHCPLVIDGRSTPSHKAYLTEELTDHALAFIERQRDAPFCLVLSHKAAERPFKPPRYLADLYTDIDPDLPPMADSWVTTTNGAAWGDAFQPLKNQFLDYCRTLTSLDRQVGRVLAQIDRLGLGDGTLVVYAGSNGCFWGEHRLVDKRWAYEESIRIPMIVRYPAVIYDPGRRADQMVLNIDLAPTFLDAAGIPVPEAMEGRSLMPILRSEHAIGRSEFLYEYFLDFPYNVPPLAAIRTERHIYIEYRGRKGPELYDLDEDPAQRHNLIHTDSGRALADNLKPRLQALLRAETP